ncbi:hypothetical protein SK128_000184 [Halocaridina rubra]|uniref:Uncharacterized protein n=1 Tax=Halocaridina rubra TaxID=373956 RepID=A0AAN8XC85_HALRR
MAVAMTPSGPVLTIPTLLPYRLPRRHPAPIWLIEGPISAKELKKRSEEAGKQEEEEEEKEEEE